MNALTRSERETVVRWSDDPEASMSISTHNEREAKRLIRAGATVRREGERGGVSYWILDAPRTWARFPKPPTRRTLTDEQRAAISERMRASRIKS